MRRKRQGASLIVVIIIFMFLATVSTAMLSMILGNYKARVAESKRVENLYASDSGLDVTYNVIGKNFDAAVKYGYYEVVAMKNATNKGPNNSKYEDVNEDIQDLNSDIKSINDTINNVKKNPQNYPDENLSDLENTKAKKQALVNEDEELQQVLIGEEFKRAFNNFIQGAYATDDENKNILTNQLQSLIENHSYIYMSGVNASNINQSKSAMVVNFGISDKEGNVNSVSPDFYPVDISPQNIAYDSKNTVGITASEGGHYKTVTISPFLKQGYYNIAVTSSFYSEKLAGNSNASAKTNERQVKANFKLSVPEFNDIYNQEAGGAIQKYLATQDRAITINGNMNLSGVNGFSVNNGEIYVGGTTPSGVKVSNRSYEKYSGGIMVYDSKDIKFNKDVITRNTLNLRSDANVTIGGNLYGRNIYIGGRDNSSDSNDATLNQSAESAALSVNKVVIDNDLGLKATKSNVTINDFFGVNDKNITLAGNPMDADGNQVDRTKSSSSIIVNSNDDSSNVIIKNSAWIEGAAHINTNETDTDSRNEYQTGESAAVEGNYIAYTVLDPSNADEKLKYYNPLQLLGEPDVIKKAKHFFNYWNTKGTEKLDTGGIQLPIKVNIDGTVDTSNIHSLGALVYQLGGQKRVVASTYNFEADPNNPDSPVYKEQAEFASKVYRFDQSATKPYDYDKTKVTGFNTLVDTSKISSSGYALEDQKNNGEYAIFNAENKPLSITKSDGNTDEIISNSDNIEIKVAKKNNGYVLNGVIVSAGNISIDYDDITINGCLIVGGDLNINGKSNININYDQDVIERVQAKNLGVFKAVFGKVLVDDTDDNQNADSRDSANSSKATDSTSASYDLKYFLEKKLWQIIK